MGIWSRIKVTLLWWKTKRVRGLGDLYLNVLSEQLATTTRSNRLAHGAPERDVLQMLVVPLI
jgi:hypothetical protein